MRSIGIDGCHKGWFIVSLIDNENWAIDIYSDIQQVWDKYQDSNLILIDIPIGLPYWRSRLCDVEARKVLKKRGSSVFPAPTREAINAPDYRRACTVNYKILGKKISIQVWNISPKIKQVDDLLNKTKIVRHKIRESHPEVCFWALAGGRPMVHPKKSGNGLQERLELLQNIYSDVENIYDIAIKKYTHKDLDKDDVLDAIALAITACSSPETLYTIPGNPERDLKELPMEIVYTNRFM